MATRLLMTSEQAFCFNSCCVARVFVIAPLLMDFIGGSMIADRKWTKLGLT